MITASSLVLLMTPGLAFFVLAAVIVVDGKRQSGGGVQILEKPETPPQR